MAEQWRPAVEWNPTEDEVRYWARTRGAMLTEEDEELCLLGTVEVPDGLLDLARDAETVQHHVIAVAIRTHALDLAQGVLGRASVDPDEAADARSQLRRIGGGLVGTHPVTAAAGRYAIRLADLIEFGVRSVADLASSALDLADLERSCEVVHPAGTSRVWWVLLPARDGTRMRIAFDLDAGRIWLRKGAASSPLTDNAPSWAVV